MARAILIVLLLLAASCGEAADEAQVRGLVEQAAAHLKAGRQQDAIQDLQRALKVKEELSTLLALAQLQAAAGQWQDAEHNLARAKQLAPVSTQVQAGLADAATLRGRWDEARTLYEELADRAPQDATPRLLLAALGDTPGAAEHALQMLSAWRKRAKNEPETRELLVAEAMLKRTLGMPPPAESPWVRARARAAGDAERAVRMARIYLRREEWTSAQILLEGASDKRPQKPELMLLAAAAIENEDIETAQKAVARADQLGKAGTFGPGPPEEQVLRARIELVTGRAAAARDRLKAALAKPAGLSEDARGRLLYWLGRSLSRLQAVPEARTQLEAVPATSSAYPAAQLALAELELASGQAQAALARLEAVAARNSPAGVALLLAKLHEDAGRAADAERVLRRALEQHPHAGSVWLALAKLLLRTSQPGPSGAALDQVLRDDPWNAEALGVRAQLAAREDKTQAIALYRKLLTAHPEHPAALNNLALLLSRSPAGLDEALSLAERAQRVRPDDPLVADTLGWIHHLRGEAALARPLLEKALARSPKDPEVQYHAGAALLAGGDRGRGRALLQAALAQSANFDGADHARALLGEQN